jgi:hypothetical protein
VTRIPADNKSDIVILPIGANVVPVDAAGAFRFSANPLDSYQLKLDVPQVFNISLPTPGGAELQIFTKDFNGSETVFAQGTSFQVALDANGTYFLRVVGSTEDIEVSISKVFDVSSSPASAAVLGIDTPVTLNVDNTDGVDWYKVALEQGSNISIERRPGLTFFISDENGSLAKANPIAPGETQQNYLISGSKSGDNTLFIRVNTADVGGPTLLVQRADAFAVGEAPAAAVAEDFDKDGTLDVAVVNRDSNSVSVLIGVGDGTFEEVVKNTALIADSGPRSLVAADFDGNGKLDLAIVNSRTDSISILLGNGDGTFQLQSETIPVGNEPFAIQAGYYDDRAQPGVAPTIDLAIANRSSSTVTILIGDGAGHFSPGPGDPIEVGQQPEILVTGDFNNDRFLDLATANNNTISILLGAGDGRFPLEYREEVNSPKALYVSDKISVDPLVDVRDDLLVLTSTNLVIWMERDIGKFMEPSDAILDSQPGFSVPPDFVPLALADLDGDLINDLVLFKPTTTDGSLAQLQTLKGMANGSFVAQVLPSEVQLPASASTSPVLFAFLNNDDFQGNQQANFLDFVFLDGDVGRVRPLTGDGQGGARAFGTPAESAAPVVAATVPASLEFPELVFAQPSAVQLLNTPPPQLAGAQIISGSGGSAGGAGELPAEDVELTFDFDERLPETELETVGSVAVDVLEIDEAAFNEPDPPWDVAKLAEPVQLVAHDTNSTTDPIARDGIAAPQPVDGIDAATVAEPTPEHGGSRVGWIAGAAAALVTPLIYWTAKRRIRLRRQR